MVNPYAKAQMQKNGRVHWNCSNGDFGKNEGRQGGSPNIFLTGFTPETPRPTTPKNKTAPVLGANGHHWRCDSPANITTGKQGAYKMGPTQDLSTNGGYYDGSGNTWGGTSQLTTYTPMKKPPKMISGTVGRAHKQIEYVCDDDFIKSIYEEADASAFLKLPTQETSSDDESNASVELVGVRKGRRGGVKKGVRVKQSDMDKKPPAKKAATKKAGTVNKKPTAKRKIAPARNGTEQGGTWVNVFIPDGDVEEVFKKMFGKCFENSGAS